METRLHLPSEQSFGGSPQKNLWGQFSSAQPKMLCLAQPRQELALRGWKGEGPTPLPIGLGAPGSPFAFFSLAPSSWRSSGQSLTSGRASQERGAKARLGCSTLPCSFPKFPRASHLREAEGKETRKEIILVYFSLFPVLWGGLEIRAAVVRAVEQPRAKSPGWVLRARRLETTSPMGDPRANHGSSRPSRHMCLLSKGLVKLKIPRAKPR